MRCVALLRGIQSHFPKLVSRPEYQRMTVRNWSTTTKLLAMLDEGHNRG